MASQVMSACLLPGPDSGASVGRVEMWISAVAPEENALIVEPRYRALGGEVEMIHKPGVGHHPHSLENPAPIVAFLEKHCLPRRG